MPLRRLRSRQGLRIACHLAAAVPFAVACIVEMVLGWRPQGDDAVITFRSWTVLSSRPPLVGMLTHVTSHHAVYDPGPMLFWLLAVPVHLDPAQGGLWGAALLCVVGISLAVEAAWSTLGWPAAVSVVAVVLAMVGELPALALDPTWNAHIGLVWFIATAATGWAVASGHLRWWPVLVVAASFASQCHLMFVLGSVACVAVAPVAGFARSRRLGWWLPVGLLAGAVSWLAPLAQQVTSSPGNLSLLLHSQERTGPATGIAFALRSLAAAVGPHPVWWGRGEVPSPDVFTLARSIDAQPAWAGVAILVGLGLCSVVAWQARRRDLAALALIAFVLSLGVVWTFASLPMAQLITFAYIDSGSWPVGMLVLLVAAWSVGELAMAAVRGLRYSPVPLHVRGRSGVQPQRWVAAFVAATTVAVVVTSGILVGRASAGNSDATSGWPAMRQVNVVTARIERSVPRGRLMVLPPPGFSYSYAVIAGVDYLLYSDGWRPESVPGYPALIGPQVALTRPLPGTRATVIYHGGPARIVIARRS